MRATVTARLWRGAWPVVQALLMGMGFAVAFKFSTLLIESLGLG